MDIKEIRRTNLNALLQKYLATGKQKKDFAEICGIAAAQLSQLLGEKSVRNIGDAIARRVETSLGYSRGWMDVVHDELSAEMPERGKIQRKQESNMPPMDEWGTVDGWDDDTPLPDDEVYIPYYKDIELAAGHGSENGDDHNGFKLRISKATLRRFGAQKENVVSFPVHGDSMIPVMNDKTSVMVDRGNKKIVDGGIYAICQDGLCRIKLLYRLPGNKLSIRSYNKDEFPDEEAEVDSVEIIGRVINWSVMAW